MYLPKTWEWVYVCTRLVVFTIAGEGAECWCHLCLECTASTVFSTLLQIGCHYCKYINGCIYLILQSECTVCLYKTGCIYPGMGRCWMLISFMFRVYCKYKTGCIYLILQGECTVCLYKTGCIYLTLNLRVNVLSAQDWFYLPWEGKVFNVKFIYI